MMHSQDHDQQRRSAVIAKQRWRLLGKALIQSKRDGNDVLKNRMSREVSVRRFSAYGLLKSDELPQSPTSNEKDEYTWFQYTSPSHQGFSICVRHLKKQFSPSELIGFNNTGNVCIWPSEEILAHHCLKNPELFREKTVCELGGGMTCLAGVAVAATASAAKVVLTDGNDLSCKNIEEIVRRNKEKFSTCQVKVRNLRWNEAECYSDLKASVDVILCADCLFFDEYRADLVDTVYNLLKVDGTALIFAPRRGHTLEEFCQQAREKFHLELEDNYDSRVWNVYQQAKTQGKEVFDEDIHYPLRITLRKKESLNSKMEYMEPMVCHWVTKVTNVTEVKEVFDEDIHHPFRITPCAQQQNGIHGTNGMSLGH